MTEVPVYDTRLVLVVVVDPQPNWRFRHKLVLPLTGPAGSRGAQWVDAESPDPRIA
jgi:hypothetical protein